MNTIAFLYFLHMHTVLGAFGSGTYASPLFCVPQNLGRGAQLAGGPAAARLEASVVVPWSLFMAESEPKKKARAPWGEKKGAESGPFVLLGLILGHILVVLYGSKST